MNSFRVASTAAIGAAVLVLALTQQAGASSGPRWSAEQLTDFSAAIVSGRVSGIATAADASGGIYTYVSIDVSEVLKGAVPDDRVVLKQAGGIIGDIGLDVSGQARFYVGEEVLVFAEVRPRDTTLYTTALWQGKWVIEIDAASGASVAVQRDDSIRNGPTEMLRVDVTSLRDTVLARAGLGKGLQTFDPVPDETPSSSESGFNLLSSPAKWLVQPVDFNVEAGCQPGLAGCLSGIATGVADWNAQSNFTWRSVATNASFRCGNTAPANTTTKDLLFAFNDPCFEISDAGGTLAVAFSWFTTTIEETFNGVGFRRMIQVTIITNNSATAMPFVTNQNCFTQVMLHEMGHALGLGHSAVSTAIMAPTVDFNQCSVAARPLQPDDIAGVRSIYGTSTGGAPGQPTNFAVTAAGNNLNMSWGAPAATAALQSAAGAATNYNLIARVVSGGAPVVTLPLGNVTSFAVTAPNGVFFLSVQGTNASGAGPESNVVQITVPALASPPGSPTNLIVNLVGDTATFTWTAPTSGSPVDNYVLRGSNAPSPAAPLASVVLPPSPTSVVIPGIPPGTWFVRVFAQNAGGNSPFSTNEVQLNVAGPQPPGTPTMNAPTVTAGNTVGLSWSPGAGGTPSSYNLIVRLSPAGPVFAQFALSLTAVSFGGVPSGTYYLQVIANNAIGSSGLSNQVMLVVP